MADLSRIATETMELIDHLEEEIEEGDTIGEILLVVQVIDEEGTEYLQWRCSSASPLIQKGLISWAYAGQMNDSSRIVESDEEDE